MPSETYKIDIKVNDVQAKSALKNIESGTKAAENNVSGLKNTFSNLNLGVLGVAGAFGLLTTGISKAIGAARRIEDLTTKFTTLTGSVDKATDLVKDLTDFTARTPFQLEGVSEAARLLVTFGTSVEDVKPLLQDLGDISAATGSDLQEVALIFGQVQAAGKLTGERYLQLAERGIVLNDILSKKLGISVSQVRDEISKGTVTFDIFKQAIQEMNDEGNIANGGMGRLAGTLSGKISTLSDNIVLFSARLGSIFTPAIKVAVDALNDMLTPVKEKSKIEIAQEELKELQKQLETGFSQKSTGGILGFSVSNEDRAGVEAKIALKQEEIARLQAIELQEEERKKQELSLRREQERVEKENDDKLKLEADKKAFNERFKLQQEEAKKREALRRANLTQSQRDLEDWNKYQLSAEKQLQAAKASIIGDGLGAIAALAKEGGKSTFAIWKASATAEATIAGYLAVQKALASSPPPWNYIAAAAVGVRSALNIRSITSTKPPAFENGGIVGGNSFTGDNISARVNSGEMVLNRQQQTELFNQANGLGGTNESVISEIKALKEAIMSKDTVLMADDIEIARSVNRAIANGFVLASS